MRLKDRLRAITPRQAALTVAVLVPLATAVAVLGATTEDVTQHNGLSTTDPAHLRFFVDHRPAVLVAVAKQATNLGAAPVLAVLALVAAAGLWWRGQRLVVVVAPGVALVAAAVIASLAKTIVGRARPPLAVRLVNETEPSFPSGHATDSAAFYLALALIVTVFVLRRPLARVALIVGSALLTGAIGLSRLVLGVHWPTDVLAGWSLGVISAFVVTMIAIAAARLTPGSHRGTVLRPRLVRILQSHRPAGMLRRRLRASGAPGGALPH